MEAASYTYRVYYEWINARGERQRSTTGELFTVDASDGLVAGDDIVLDIPTLTHTEKGTDVSIVVYRTEKDPNIVGGAPFYRCSSPDPTSTGDNAYLANSTSAATVTFTDAMADTDLVAKELDYLNSGGYY